MSKANPPSLLILNQMAGPLGWDMAEDLGKAFGRVTMLTGHPDILAKGSNEHVRLQRSPAYHRGSFGQRMISWLRYVLHAFFWVWRFPRRTPLLLFTNPPLLPWLGYLLHLLRGQRYTIMVWDIYPDTLVQHGVVSERHPLARIWAWLNRRAYERADAVMTLGEDMAAVLDRQFDVTRTKAGRVEVVYPWADTARILPIGKDENWFAREHKQVGKLTVMYSGNMGISHDIETMLDAAARLQANPNIHFMFIGAGPKWQLVKDTLDRQKLTNVTLLSWQADEVVPYSLATADVALVSLEADIAGLMLPSKAFSSLAAGTPLVVMCSRETELAEIVQRHGCGWVIQPERADELCAILLELAADPSGLIPYKERSRRTAEKIGSRANSAALINIYNRTLPACFVAERESATQLDYQQARPGRAGSREGSEPQKAFIPLHLTNNKQQ